MKIELNEYNPSVLRHIGKALMAIAADQEGNAVVGKAGCDVHPEVVAFTPPPPTVAAPAGGGVFQTPEVIQTYETASPVLEEVYGGTPQGGPAVVEEDDDFPNPPGTVPAPPIVVVPPPPAATELDSAGIPWDARIHAATKTKCKDGSWKNKPGVDPTLLAAVAAELKGVQAIPAPPAAAGVPTQTAPATFAELVAVVGPFVSPGGKLMPERAQQVNEICQNVGLPNLGALGARTDLIPTVWSQLCLIL